MNAAGGVIEEVGREALMYEANLPLSEMCVCLLACLLGSRRCLVTTAAPSLCCLCPRRVTAGDSRLALSRLDGQTNKHSGSGGAAQRNLSVLGPS